MYIIFDMDGVIIDSEKLYLKSYFHAAEVHNLPKEVMDDVAVKCTGVNEEMEKDLMVSAFGDLPDFNYEEVFATTRKYFNNAITNGKIDLKAGVKEILDFLEERGIKKGLASSSPMDIIKRELGAHQILDYFDVIVSGDMVEKSKPDPDIFFACASLMGIKAEEYKETYVVEDSYNGVRAAYNAGMIPIMIPDVLPPTEEMEEIACRILPSLKDLTGLPW